MLHKMDDELEAKFVSIEAHEFLSLQEHAGILHEWDIVASLLNDRLQELRRFGQLLDALENNRVCFRVHGVLAVSVTVSVTVFRCLTASLPHVLSLVLTSCLFPDSVINGCRARS